MTTTQSPPARRCAILCDLDGVVWLAHQPVPGSVAAIAELRAHGHRVLFVTNNSQSRVEEQEAALAAIGVPAGGDVLTSAMAAARLLLAGERALVAGGPGVTQALERRGVTCITAADVDGGAVVDAVVVGLHRGFDYAGLARAARAVQRGARLIGTNNDATYPTPNGPVPGGGSILAAISTAAGVEPQIAGKPFAPMAELVRDALGAQSARDAVMIGDRPSTDGRFARVLGCRYAHVFSGVTERGMVIDPRPELSGDDLAEIAAVVLKAGAADR